MTSPPAAGAAELLQARRRGLALSERKLLLLAGDSRAGAPAFPFPLYLPPAEGRPMGVALPPPSPWVGVVPYRITRPTLLLWVPLAAMALMAWRLLYRAVFAGEIFAGSLVVVADPISFRQVWPDATGVMRGLYRVVEVVSPARPDCADIVEELAAEGRVDQIILGVREEVPRDIFPALLGCSDPRVPVVALTAPSP